MKRLIFLLLFVINPKLCLGQLPSQYKHDCVPNWNVTDTTSAIQGCLTHAANDGSATKFHRVILKLTKGQKWISGPLFIPSYTDFIVEEGILLEALSGGFGPSDSFLTLDNVESTRILARNAEIKMLISEYTGEQRHGIRVLSGTNIEIDGPKITDTGGDGVYLGNSAIPGAPEFSSNVIINNIETQCAGRSGISVITVDGLNIINSEFNNTGECSELVAPLGPHAGINYEPNGVAEKLENMYMNNCSFYNNRFHIKFATASLPTAVTASFSNCDLETARVAAITHGCGTTTGISSYSYTGMTITDSINRSFAIVDCDISDNKNTFIFGNSFIYNSNSISGGEMLVRAANYDTGNLIFNNIDVMTSNANYILEITSDNPETAYVRNITGNIDTVPCPDPLILYGTTSYSNISVNIVCI